MDYSEKISWLRLIRTENIGPITFYKLLERFGTAENALKMLPNMANRGGRLKNLKLCSIKDAEGEMKAAESLGARMLARDEKGYPSLLAELEDAPPIITVLGNIDVLSKPALGVVGSRNSSTVGNSIAKDLSGKVSKAGFVIASGLARGIDTAAHISSIENGTIAVVAGGIDVIYPKENKKLFEDIIVKCGAIIAESPLGTEPIARHFPKRNRIISGLSLGVLVIEAAIRSGSLITARSALEQNREVFACPGNIKDPRAAGTNKLIKDGAHQVLSAEDIIMELRSLRHQPMQDSGSNELEGSLGLTDAIQIPEPDEELYQKVLDALNYTPINIDELIRALSAPAADILTVLLELELAGEVERHIGGKVSLG